MESDYYYFWDKKGPLFLRRRKEGEPLFEGEEHFRHLWYSSDISGNLTFFVNKDGMAEEFKATFAETRLKERNFENIVKPSLAPFLMEGRLHFTEEEKIFLFDNWSELTDGFEKVSYHEYVWGKCLKAGDPFLDDFGVL